MHNCPVDVVSQKELETGVIKFNIKQFEKVCLSDNMKGKPKPCARSGHRAVADDDHIWMFGGYNSEVADENNDGDLFPLFREFWKFNLSTCEWSLMRSDENMPHEVASHSAILKNNYMFVFGGTGFPFGENSSDQLSACRLNTGKWTIVNSTGTKPEKIYGQAMALIDSFLYIYGGTTGFVYNTDLHRLDLSSRVWEKLEPKNYFSELPPERYRHEVACYNNHLFVFGGGTSHIVYGMDRIHVYSIDENSWFQRSTKPDQRNNSFPAARRCHSCVQLDSRAYICGGCNGRVILGNLWQIDLDNLQWTKMADMPEPVYFHSAAVTSEGCMVVFGGVTCINKSTRTDSCYQIWLKIPSLQTMCWLTLVKTRPGLLRMSHRDLLHMGINRTFISKLPRAEGA